LGLSGFATLRGVWLGTVEPWLALCHGLKLVEYSLVAVVVAGMLSSIRGLRWSLWLSVGATVAAALLFGVIADLVVPDADLRHVIERFFPGEGSNILGGYLMYQLILLTSLWLQPPVGRIAVLGLVATAIPVGYALMSTASRSSIAGLLAGCTLLGAWVNRWLWLVMAALILLAPLYLPPDVRYFLQLAGSELTGRVRWNLATRLEEWQVDWAVIGQRPLLGLGLSMRPPSPMSGQPGPVDNEYLKIGLETGLLGLLVFAWLVIRVGHTAHGIYRRSTDPSLKALATGYGAGLVALLIHGLTATSFTAVRTAEVFWFTTGLLIAADRLVTRST
jgi:O-antigen ligase